MPKRYQLYRSQGLCGRCGKVPPRENKVLCESCYKADSTQKARRYTNKKKSGECIDCPSTELVSGCFRCRICLDRENDHNRRLKKECLIAYGSKCSCCGEQQYEFLSLDHVNNDGAKHRKEIGGGGRIYAWAKKHSYPPNLQILCFNCNLSKGFHGYCPHQLNHPGDNEQPENSSDPRPWA